MLFVNLFTAIITHKIPESLTRLKRKPGARIREMDMREIQADEIRTFAGNKKKASWIFATVGVWSRF